MYVAIRYTFLYFIFMKIQQVIKYHLTSKNFETLEASLQVGFEQLPRTRHFKRLLKEGFSLLAEYYEDVGNLFQALESFEFCRTLSPNSTEILSQEVSLINRIFYKYSEEFVFHDFQMFQSILHYFNHLYSPKYPNIVQPLLSIENECENKFINSDKSEESKHTYRINKFYCIIYENLTEEEQAEIFADIISEYLQEELGQEENVIPDDN